MDIPTILSPTATEDIRLPEGQLVQIAKATPVFNVWVGEPVQNTYGGKAVLDFNGKPAFAEVVILKMFQAAGWDGVWADTFGGKYRTESCPRNVVDIPPHAKALLESISQSIDSTQGCWDVYCWREDTFIFAESKRRGRDSIRDTQRRWLHAALKHGLPASSFLVVAWSTR